MPEELQEGVLYVCLRYATAIHLCCCGCGHKAVTPIIDDEHNWGHRWSIDYDGQVTLNPSILNTWCGAHYWVRKNQVVWA